MKMATCVHFAYCCMSSVYNSSEMKVLMNDLLENRKTKERI